MFSQKYLKYKEKYLHLKKIYYGGTPPEEYLFPVVYDNDSICFIGQEEDKLVLIDSAWLGSLSNGRLISKNGKIKFGNTSRSELKNIIKLDYGCVCSAGNREIEEKNKKIEEEKKNQEFKYNDGCMYCNFSLLFENNKLHLINGNNEDTIAPMKIPEGKKFGHYWETYNTNTDDIKKLIDMYMNTKDFIQKKNISDRVTNNGTNFSYKYGNAEIKFKISDNRAELVDIKPGTYNFKNGRYLEKLLLNYFNFYYEKEAEKIVDLRCPNAVTKLLIYLYENVTGAKINKLSTGTYFCNESGSYFLHEEVGRERMGNIKKESNKTIRNVKKNVIKTLKRNTTLRNSSLIENNPCDTSNEDNIIYELLRLKGVSIKEKNFKLSSEKIYEGKDNIDYCQKNDAYFIISTCFTRDKNFNTNNTYENAKTLENHENNESFNESNIRIGNYIENKNPIVSFLIKNENSNILTDDFLMKVDKLLDCYDYDNFIISGCRRKKMGDKNFFVRSGNEIKIYIVATNQKNIIDLYMYNEVYENYVFEKNFSDLKGGYVLVFNNGGKDFGLDGVKDGEYDLPPDTLINGYDPSNFNYFNLKNFQAEVEVEDNKFGRGDNYQPGSYMKKIKCAANSIEILRIEKKPPS